MLPLLLLEFALADALTLPEDVEVAGMLTELDAPPETETGGGVRETAAAA